MDQFPFIGISVFEEIELDKGLVIACCVSVVVSIIVHNLVKRIIIASVLASLGSGILFLLVDFLHVGYIDPFFPIAFINTMILAFPFALTVGMVMGWRRNRKATVARDQRGCLGENADENR